MWDSISIAKLGNNRKRDSAKWKILDLNIHNFFEALLYKSVHSLNTGTLHFHFYLTEQDK